MPTSPSTSSEAEAQAPPWAKRRMLLVFFVTAGAFGLGNYFLFRWAQARDTTPPVVIASFRADFQAQQPKPGWRYLWNAGGPIGDASDYKELQWSEVMGGAYVANPTGAYPAPTPARYLRVTPTGGHPGQGPSQSKSDDECQAIFAFTVSKAGRHRLVSAMIARHSGPKLGSIHLGVFVNTNAVGPDIICRSREGVVFDRELGRLAAGDTVYVVVGPGDADTEDGFDLDFSIQR